LQSDGLKIPPLSETRHSRESLIEALRDRALLPPIEVAMATVYAGDIQSEILALLAHARAEACSGRTHFRSASKPPSPTAAFRTTLPPRPFSRASPPPEAR
jgi:hypothetical protein